MVHYKNLIIGGGVLGVSLHKKLQEILRYAF